MNNYGFKVNINGTDYDNERYVSNVEIFRIGEESIVIKSLLNNVSFKLITEMLGENPSTESIVSFIKTIGESQFNSQEVQDWLKAYESFPNLPIINKEIPQPQAMSINEVEPKVVTIKASK